MKDSPLLIARFRELLSAYGAEPVRWPERDRQAALALLEESESARTSSENEQPLDLWFANLQPPELDSEFEQRLNAIPARNAVSPVRRLVPRILIAPALAWAAAAAVGLWLGSHAAAGEARDTRELSDSPLLDDAAEIATSTDWLETQDGLP